MTSWYGIEPGRLISYLPILSDALSLSNHKPEHCIVVKRPNHPTLGEPVYEDIQSRNHINVLDWETAHQVG